LKIIYPKFPLKGVNGNSIVNSNSFKIWRGLAFERFCWRHSNQIKRRLKIEALGCSVNSVSGKDYQIDLLFDREDNFINLCECKYYNKPFILSKEYGKTLNLKRDRFIKDHNITKSCSWTIITSHGLKINSNTDNVVDNQIDIRDLIYN